MMRRIFQVAPVILALSVGACDKKDDAAADGKAEDKKAEDKKGAEGKTGDKSADAGAATNGGGAFERLPDDCEVAVSIDLKALLGYSKVKSDILPVLQAAMDKKDPEDKKSQELQKFLAASKLSLDSFDSVAVCVKDVNGPQPTFAVAIAGAALTKGTIIPALQSMADEDDKDDFKEVNGRPALSGDGMLAYQLDDGTLVVGSSAEYMAKLDNKNKNYSSKYNLDTGKFLSFNVGATVMKNVPPVPNAPKSLGEMKSVSGLISLAPPEAKVTIECGSESNATEIAAFITLMKATMGGAVGSDNTFGQKDAFDGATAKADGTTVVIAAPVPLDKGITAAAPLLKSVAG